jgi:hypothetical protein
MILAKALLMFLWIFCIYVYFTKTIQLFITKECDKTDGAMKFAFVVFGIICFVLWFYL